MNELPSNDPWAAAATYPLRAEPPGMPLARRALTGLPRLLATGAVFAAVLLTRSVLLLIAIVATAAAAHTAAVRWRNEDEAGARHAAVSPASFVLAIAYCAFLDQCFNGVTAEPYYVCGNASLGVPFVVAFLVFVGACACRLRRAPSALRTHPIATGRGAVALGIALSLLGARAAQRAAHAPERDDWVNAQPLVATSAAATSLGARAHRLQVPGACIERRCDSSERAFASCTLHVARRCDARPVTASIGHSMHVSPDGLLRVRRARDGTLLVQDSSEHGDTRAFRSGTLAPITLTTGMLAPQLAAPRGWIVGGLLAGALATVLGALSLRRRRWEAAGWARAIHAGDGAILVAGERLWHPLAARFTTGVLWVRVGEAVTVPHRSAAHRTVLDLSLVSPGAMRTRAKLLESLGIAGALCLAAPLLTAALIGLV